jgi:fructose transport system ATP-binding protein
MPPILELADRVHVLRLGRRVAILTLGVNTMEEAVAIMTGAAPGNLESEGAIA